jgi:hypothetical protein
MIYDYRKQYAGGGGLFVGDNNVFSVRFPSSLHEEAKIRISNRHPKFDRVTSM